MRVSCEFCGIETDLSANDWCCDCGHAWEPFLSELRFNPKEMHRSDYSIWRYGEMLGLDIGQPFKQFGVGWTPLVPANLFGHDVHLKLEYLSPSGSFKDRGTNTMVNQLIHMGVENMIEDSSGNAGASLAAHAAKYGLNARIFVPEYASPAKLHQIGIYGAEIIKVPGTRREVEKAAINAVASSDSVYASHAYHPAYLAGQLTAAWELWEQLGCRAPDWIISPVAQGGQFLGFWLGFKLLLQEGLVEHLPRLVAVQAEKVAPLHFAWEQRLADVPAIESPGPTIAEGVAVQNPVRGKRLLQALRETKGFTLAIAESDIVPAQKLLARQGYYVEPTSALVIAAFRKMRELIKQEQVIVLMLTGNGLKGAPQFR